jgi:sterol desaturase/sphingolipid hydroxylase (fatty acid hydroxylase superfamily)
MAVNHLKQKVASDKTSRLFRSEILESLTRTHIAVPLTVFYGSALVILVYSFYLGAIAPWSNLYFFVGGVLAFTLIEYLVHRYAFHIEMDTDAKARFQYFVHGAHHAFPRDKSRLAMPPIASILLAAGFFILYKFIMGYNGLPFTAGFLSGYAIYLCIHYSVHSFRPPKNVLKVLWRHHAMHHFKQQDAAFGVSSPLWDLVFGTMPDKQPNDKLSHSESK